MFRKEEKGKGLKRGIFFFIRGEILLEGKVWRATNNNKTGRNYNNYAFSVKLLLYFLLKIGYKEGAML